MIQIVCKTDIYCEKRPGFDSVLYTDNDFDLIRDDILAKIYVYYSNGVHICEEYKHHFMTLSKWREQQINLILDEEE
jgi:hypothetical protein